MELKELVTELLSELGKISKTDSVVGGVREAGTAKVLPLSRIRIGFGTAVAEAGGKSSTAGDAGGSGGGAGGAVVVEPRAFVVVGEDGVPRLLTLDGGKQGTVRDGVEISAHTEGEPALEPSGARRLGPRG
ncbi:MAG TPA: spore germination protein GerW family protein [Polyangiaceae bacterium]|nr:spore germination protein GerW family protein [Polyangiaceae bacterium]